MWGNQPTALPTEGKIPKNQHKKIPLTKGVWMYIFNQLLREISTLKLLQIKSDKVKNLVLFQTQITIEYFVPSPPFSIPKMTSPY